MSRDPIDGRTDYEYSREIESSVDAALTHEANSVTFKDRNNKAAIIKAALAYVEFKRSTTNIFQKPTFFHPAGTVEIFDTRILSKKIEGYKVHVEGKYLIIKSGSEYVVRPDESSADLYVKENISKSLEDARNYAIQEAVNQFVRTVAANRNIDMTQEWFNSAVKKGTRM